MGTKNGTLYYLQMYTMPGNCTPLGRQTREGSPDRTWQAGGGSFLLLPRRHALSSRWLLTFNHNTCEKRLEEVQGSATSFLFTPPLFQDTWRVYSSCVRSAMLHASETWPLTKLNLQRMQRNDRAMIRQICNIRPQDIVTTRSNELLASPLLLFLVPSSLQFLSVQFRGTFNWCDYFINWCSSVISSYEQPDF